MAPYCIFHMNYAFFRHSGTVWFCLCAAEAPVSGSGVIHRLDRNSSGAITVNDTILVILYTEYCFIFFSQKLSATKRQLRLAELQSRSFVMK